jgi:asparagine synthase (glutamine-hydrolysing)
LTDEFREYVDDVYSGFESSPVAARNWFDTVSALTIEGYLRNDILVKLDRASMFASLEARTPFLDVDLAEFIMGLPMEMKREKRILKSLMRGRIPDSIIDRKKQGFAFPLGHWLRRDLYEWAYGTLTMSSGVNIYRTEEAVRLLEEHRRGRRDHRKKLWTLLMLKIWQNNWVG